QSGAAMREDIEVEDQRAESAGCRNRARVVEIRRVEPGAERRNLRVAALTGDLFLHAAPLRGRGGGARGELPRGLEVVARRLKLCVAVARGDRRSGGTVEVDRRQRSETGHDTGDGQGRIAAVIHGKLE